MVQWLEALPGVETMVKLMRLTTKTMQVILLEVNFRSTLHQAVAAAGPPGSVGSEGQGHRVLVEAVRVYDYEKDALFTVFCSIDVKSL